VALDVATEKRTSPGPDQRAADPAGDGMPEKTPADATNDKPRGPATATAIDMAVGAPIVMVPMVAVMAGIGGGGNDNGGQGHGCSGDGKDDFSHLKAPTESTAIYQRHRP